MKNLTKTPILGLCLMAVLLFEVLPLYLVSDAFAVYGTRRRTARRTAVIVDSANEAETQQAEQEAAAAQAEADSANAAAAASQAEADALKKENEELKKENAAASASGALPLGSVVEALPQGCTKKVIAGVEYQFDGVNYFKAAFQGSKLVYVTVQP